MPKRYVHVPGDRLQALCRKLGIKFAQALVDFGGKKRYGFHPVFDGVVVSARSAVKLQAAIAERKARASSPKAIAAKERGKKRRQELLVQSAEEIGAMVGSRTHRAYRRGELDQYTARLIAFKAKYRHEHTDYEERLAERPNRTDFGSYEDYRIAKEWHYEEARESREDDPIPDNWPEYLETYGFSGRIAEAMAGVLQNPMKAHPIWFCKCMLGLEMIGADVSALSYEKIRDAGDRLGVHAGNA